MVLFIKGVFFVLLTVPPAFSRRLKAERLKLEKQYPVKSPTVEGYPQHEVPQPAVVVDSPPAPVQPNKSDGPFDAEDFELVDLSICTPAADKASSQVPSLGATKASSQVPSVGATKTGALRALENLDRARQWLKKQMQKPEAEKSAAEMMAEWEHDKQVTRAACLAKMSSHLDSYLLRQPFGSYEEWIADVHPESVRKRSWPIAIDYRYYLGSSDHRKLWNQQAGKLRYVPASDSVSWSQQASKTEAAAAKTPPTKETEAQRTKDAKAPTAKEVKESFSRLSAAPVLSAYAVGHELKRSLMC